MTPIFSANDYNLLHHLAFLPENKGYNPSIHEAPNGDGKIDYRKRYAHISKKYISQMPIRMRNEQELMNNLLRHAHGVAEGIATELGVPREYMPDMQDGTLRVLEYDHTAGSEEHSDFDLFTLMCYRNLPQFFETVHDSSYSGVVALERARALNAQFHFGELYEIICPSVQATKHLVRPTNQPGVHQYSVVYFSMPKLTAVLPSGQTVGQWVDERKKRSRY